MDYLIFFLFFLKTALQNFKFLLYYHSANNVLRSKTVYAPVAQLDRVSDSDSEGRWFESSRAYQKPP